VRAGLLILLVLAAATLAAPWWLPAPDAVDLAARFEPPSPLHPLGTDDLGRDVAARLAQGGLVSLSVAAVTALMAALVGTAVGLLAGYRGGVTDALLMRLADGVMALPLLPLLIVMAAADTAKLGVPPAVTESEAFAVLRPALIIACVAWTGVARLVRAATLSVRARDYVRAAEALGARPGRIMLRHILPNVASPMVVATTLSVGNIILIESALSFLGLGIRPPLASWGNMLTGAMDVVWSAPMLAFWPGAAILATVLGFNLLGDGLQRRLDPRSRPLSG
jgi:peptide/nickel transport system permease protein